MCSSKWSKKESFLYVRTMDLVDDSPVFHAYNCDCPRQGVLLNGGRSATSGDIPAMHCLERFPQN